MSTKSLIIIALSLFIAIVGAGLMIAGSIYLSKPESIDTIPLENNETAKEIEVIPKTLIVEATGSVEVNPDYAIINFLFGCDERPSAKSAYNEISKDIAYTKDILADLNILEEDISFSGVNTYRSYYGSFNADGSIQVKIRDMDNLPEILTTFAEQAAYRQSWYRIELEDRSMAYEAAVEKAILEAECKAKVISEKMGFKLGEVISLSNVEPFTTSYERQYYSSYNYPNTATIGMVQVIAYVSIEYEIQ